MSHLLDTHIFLWALMAPEKLTPKVRALLEDGDSQLWLSPISVWETLVLAERKRIELQPGARHWLEQALQQIPTREAPLTHRVAMESCALSFAHKDPADRFLVATARVYELTLVTADRRLLEAKACNLLRN